MMPASSKHCWRDRSTEPCTALPQYCLVTFERSPESADGMLCVRRAAQCENIVQRSAAQGPHLGVELALNQERQAEGPQRHQRHQRQPHGRERAPAAPPRACAHVLCGGRPRAAAGAPSRLRRRRQRARHWLTTPPRRRPTRSLREFGRICGKHVGTIGGQPHSDSEAPAARRLGPVMLPPP